MNRTERALAASTLVVLVGGGATWLWVSSRSGRATVPVSPGSTRSSGPGEEAPDLVAGAEGVDSAKGAAPGRGGTATGGRVPSSLREPSGEDLSDPSRVNALLRRNLAAEVPRWDWIAELVAVAPTLDPWVKASLEEQLIHGNASGALQAYGRLRDPSVTADLLKALDDPSIEPVDRRAILQALASMPGADPAEVVTGIEGRLAGDYARDLPYLQAIARRGGAEAARALVDAILRSPSPGDFTEEAWRDLDLRRDAAAAEAIAHALADRSRSPETLRAVVALAGKPGASPALVDALLALDVAESNDALRREVLASLARTGDERAMARLVEVASSAGGDDASAAAAAIGSTSSASPASRALLLDAARKTKDEALRERIVTALGGVRDEKAVPDLVEWTASGSDSVRKASVVALGRIGPAAAEAVPALGRAFQSGDEALQGHVAAALGSIGTPAALALLEQLDVTGVSKRVRTAIANAVQRIRSERR